MRCLIDLCPQLALILTTFPIMHELNTHACLAYLPSQFAQLQRDSILRKIIASLKDILHSQ